MLRGFVLAAVVVLAAVSMRTGRLGVLALAAASVLWLLLNGGRTEGQVLVPVIPEHGLTATDLAGLAGLAIAAWRGLELRRGRAKDPETS